MLYSTILLVNIALVLYSLLSTVQCFQISLASGPKSEIEEKHRWESPPHLVPTDQVDVDYFGPEETEDHEQMSRLWWHENEFKE